jgi:hypothetical protein
MTDPSVILLLSPRQAKWLHRLLAFIPLAIARDLRRSLGGILAQYKIIPAGDTKR